MPSKEYIEMLNKEGGSLTPPSNDKGTKRDWWYYHRIFFIIGAVLVAFVGFFIYDLATRVIPDYNVGIVSQSFLPEETLNAIAVDISMFAQDLNEDGTVNIQMNLYNQSLDPDEPAVDANTQMAAVTRFSADLSMPENVIIFTDNFDEVQTTYSIFGTLGDSGMPAQTIEEGSVAVADTALVPTVTEFVDPMAQQAYETFYETFVFGVRLVSDEIKSDADELLIQNAELLKTLSGIDILQ